MMQFNANYDDNCDDDDVVGHLLGVVGGCHCNVKMISGPLLPWDCKRLFLKVSLLPCTYLLFAARRLKIAFFSMSQCFDFLFCCWWNECKCFVFLFFSHSSIPHFQQEKGKGHGARHGKFQIIYSD